MFFASIVDMEKWNNFTENLDGDGIKQSISNPGSDIILEPDIKMNTSAVTGTQKQQIFQQHGESTWRYR